MNTDISGIGVRISFYLQTIFLGEFVCPTYALASTHAVYSLSICKVRITTRIHRIFIYSHCNEHGHVGHFLDFGIKAKTGNELP